MMMKIAFIASEIFPYAKTGGLADVAGALPKVLENLGCDVKLFIPKYGSIEEKKFGLKFISNIKLPVEIAGKTRMVYLHRANLPGTRVEVNFIDCPYHFFRDKIYTNDPDEDERFILFNKAVIELILQFRWIPDILHCNDWQTGLIPVYLKNNYTRNKRLKNISTLYTIHNIGYQGTFSESTFSKSELNKDLLNSISPVFPENFSFMKYGILFSDIINTVSKTYASEILTPEYGEGMEQILDKKKSVLVGITNGIDYSEWNPLTDENLPFHFDFDHFKGKARNKKFLLDYFKLEYNENLPVIAMVSRLVGQKGFDIFAEAMNELIKIDAQWLFLGIGEDRYEDLFKSLTHAYPDKIGSYIGYNNELSHIIVAGSDIFLMPSRYEPCGLNQIYSLRYGTVPVVRRTGGLADTVRDWHEFKQHGSDSGNGFSFFEYSGNALLTTVQRAVETFKDKQLWKKIIKNGMSEDLSWEKSGRDYLDLYRRCLKK